MTIHSHVKTDNKFHCKSRDNSYNYTIIQSQHAAETHSSVLNRSAPGIGSWQRPRRFATGQVCNAVCGLGRWCDQHHPGLRGGIEQSVTTLRHLNSTRRLNIQTTAKRAHAHSGRTTSCPIQNPRTCVHLTLARRSSPVPRMHGARRCHTVTTSAHNHAYNPWRASQLQISRA